MTHHNAPIFQNCISAQLLASGGKGPRPYTLFRYPNSRIPTVHRRPKASTRKPTTPPLFNVHRRRSCCSCLHHVPPSAVDSHRCIIDSHRWCGFLACFGFLYCVLVRSYCFASFLCHFHSILSFVVAFFIIKCCCIVDSITLTLLHPLLFSLVIRFSRTIPGSYF